MPLIASATATFLFRQFFLTVPDELAEAARIDGAGPLKFFWDILLPLSRTNLAALFVILFIYGWNQYLWPLLITTDESMYTIVMGIQRMVTAADAEPLWNYVMAVSMLAMLPPVAVVVADAALVRQGPDRDREVGDGRRSCSTTCASPSAGPRSSRASRPRSTTASCASCSAPRAAANRPCCA